MTKVLIVDDDEIYRTYLTSILQGSGYQIAGAAASGDEAVRLAGQAEVDVVLLDIQLGHSIDGIETARRLRDIIDSPIIFISAYDSETFIEKTRGINAAACLIKPVKFPDLGLTIRTVIERHGREKKWKEETESNAHSQRIETVGLLAGGIAHEFNSLLTVILGYAKFGQKQVPADSTALTTFQEIYKTARNASNLTRQILAFSSNQMIEFASVDVCDVVRRSLKFAKSILDDDLEIVDDTEKNPIYVMADPVQLEQALVNLYRNAREAMHGKGRLEVSCRRESAKSSHSSSAEESVVIVVRDTGVGISAENMPKVFDPFFTTKPRGEGSGLGLSVVHGIVRQHKGRIKIDSEKGVGTSISLELPLASGPLENEMPVHQESGKTTILIAEDTELLKKMLNTILTDLGYDVLVAGDGEEAIRVFRENAEKIQIVLLDMVMPKKTGREVYETLKPEAEHVKFLLSSGYTSDKDILAFAKKNRIELIPKPYEPDELARKIRSLTGNLAVVD